MNVEVQRLEIEIIGPIKGVLLYIEGLRFSVVF